MGISTSVESLSGIFGGLNSEGVSGLRLFAWARGMDPSLCDSSDVCSLIIDNCGWLDDYGTMFRLLKEFSSRQICLNEKAFGFLLFLCSNKASMLESTRRVVNLLNEVGGSCLGSGICGLLKMLSKLDLFDLAKFVMEITDRRVPYYNILILEICQRCCFEEAHDMIEEMRQFGCDPDSRTYNYLLSSLCKHDRTAEVLNVFREMQNKGCPPDSLTYEIVIYFLCRLGKLDIAGHFYDMMVSRGLEPRLATFTTLIEGYFKSGQYEDAYNYVVASGDKFWHSGNRIYSFLADLYRRKGHLMTAAKILIEMMDKGLIPEFPVYMTITKRVYKCGGGQLASDLKRRFTRLRYKGEV
ncbi:pentatricopeptide repeat-containing protein At4g31850, chloroplastic-like [Diospyros lotus]|uniref:pentatricopeptide repeat-containing protein At4g31850, chloroplastic-like n=1 Tax=Diospyros lotus TaxID=55363 RepID=UPI00225878C1|nr:pentatricopeptide repeat-containing protein At4g31850, chloroplastic-like [Diospyros lotus]